jgi:uncharacterized protein
MNNTEILIRVEDFARSTTVEFDSGHDWWHLQRVRNLALYLQRFENKGDRFIIELSALLHDVCDSKFKKANDPGADKIISDLLIECGLTENMIQEVIRINKYISFSSKDTPENRSAEFDIVQDADRLDAIGAIGIARAFNYGGFINNAIFIPGNGKSSKQPSTILHFYEKLLLLKDMMNTPTAAILALERHRILKEFLVNFYKEWYFPIKPDQHTVQ